MVIGTGIVFCAQASQLYIWTSVPQMDVFRTRISTSSSRTSGIGTSSSQSPGSARLFTTAFIIFCTAKNLAGKAPNPKLQHPEKLQASISKHQEPNAVWSLNIDLLWSLDFGAWSLRITRTIRHPLRPLSALALGSFPQDDATACR